MVRGEIDNRVKGFVRGNIWIEGRSEPIVLELEGNAWPDLAGCDPAFTVASLKRALEHLHKSQAGLEALVPKKLLPDKVIAEARQELFEIREGILKLMDEFRGRK